MSQTELELEKFQYDTQPSVLYASTASVKKYVKIITLIEQVMTYNNDINYLFAGTMFMGNCHYYSF